VFLSIKGGKESQPKEKVVLYYPALFIKARDGGNVKIGR
jgi:hypothetical protein